MKKENSTIREKLNFLSKFSDVDYPFITLYMNVNSQDFLGQVEKNRIFLKNSIKMHTDKIKEAASNSWHGKLNSFENDIEKIQRFLDTDLDTTSHGIAIFACDELGVFETFQSLIPFENEFNVDSFPHLKQLAFLADEYENALVIMVDSRFSRVFDVKLGGLISTKFESKADVHKFHKQGGWAQLRYQRGIEQEKAWHYKETASFVTKLIDEETYSNVILIGQDYEVKNFEKHLPKRVLSKVIGLNNLQMYENINAVLENIVNDLYAKEKEREFETVNDLITRAQSKDGASVGLDDIIDLAKEGRIRMLAVVKDMEYKGYRSGDCLYTAKGQKKVGCPICNGGSKETDLLEEVIRLTIKNGGKVELLEHETPAGEELERYQGIGAYLRY